MDEGGLYQRKPDVKGGETPELQPANLEDVLDSETEYLSPPGSPTTRPRLSRSSFSYQDDWETFPPLDQLTVFDLFDNLSLSQRLERVQRSLNLQREKVKKQQEKLRSTSKHARDRVVGEWKRRVPTADEQLEKYRRRMKSGVERLSQRWNAASAVTLREKISFIAGVLNIFISGYLLGSFPEYFYIWFSAQLVYFMPIRFYRYHSIGYHYFLADLCYFVNMLCMLSIWAFPQSRRLFISSFCLTFGNNAVAIAMWRNSMVFHSMDKVVSLFIHIMPPVTLHCIVHLTPLSMLEERFPAVYKIKTSDPDAFDHFGLGSMVVWATVPYVIWQLSYHLFITVRRADKIAAGRPTSFTWLRKSYAKAWIGRLVLSLPESLQSPAFMLIQYLYALLTMIPCPLWLWSRWASGVFITALFILSIHNGATYYIDVFGKRFQKELEELKKDVARWQSSPEGALGPMTPSLDAVTTGASKQLDGGSESSSDQASLEKIPPLDSNGVSTAVEEVSKAK